MNYLVVLAGIVMASYITNASAVEWYMPCILWFGGVAFGASIFND